MLKYFYIFFFFCQLNAQVIYNAYARVTSITSQTLLAVSNVNETNHTFVVGEQVIVMQMQDDVIGTNTTNTSSFGNLSAIASAGLYEIRTVTVVNRSAGTPTTIGLSSALVNTYNTGSNSSVQLITFRRLNAAAFTTTASITGVAWTGSVGGVIALDVGTDFTISHSITANGLGFRGGTVSANYYGGGTTCSTIDFATSVTRCAQKGESIYAITSTTRALGIGKALNGGGGGGQDINGGGGGGGNFTAGGIGGCGWNGGAGCTSPCAGGLAGITLSANISASRVFMGGGGGGGQQNNSAASAGGRGGGIILIKANRIITGGCAFNPTITANGNTATNPGNDGGGGGGAGGSIVLQVPTYSVGASCPLVIRANGGNGGNVTDGGAHAGGGAGGQGVVIYSIAQPTVNITTQTNNGTPGCNNSSCASSAGSAAGSNSVGVVALASGPLPIKLLFFKALKINNKTQLNWCTATEMNTDYFVVNSSDDGFVWKEISKVKAAGNSDFERCYETKDTTEILNIKYYQLITIDKDFKKSFSRIEAIDFNVKSNLLSFYPNPTEGLIHIFGSENSENFNFEIRDMKGELMHSNILSKEENKIKVDVSNLKSGIYILKLFSNETQSKVHKLIIH